jgi:hypothetical protein
MANQEAVLTLHFLIEKRVSHVRKCLRLAQDRITTFLPNGTIDTKGPYASPLVNIFHTSLLQLLEQNLVEFSYQQRS